MSPSMAVCAVAGCPRLTRGLHCSRHAGMTPDELASEEREIRARSARAVAYRKWVDALIAAGDADEDEIEEARCNADAAQRDLEELFGQDAE